MWFPVDLHLHTEASSDCNSSPESVVQAAAARGLRLCAITDHHSFRGVRPARQAARGLPLTVLPGVELTCPTGRSGVHVLGIFPSIRFNAKRMTEELELEAAGIGSAKGHLPYGAAEAVNRIQRLGGLAIAAHANSEKGLLRECRSYTLKEIIDTCRFDAIELSESRDPWAGPVASQFAGTAVISGSDAHCITDFESASHRYGVASRPFWASAPAASFVGLRSALDAGPESVDPTGRLDALSQHRTQALLRLNSHWVRAISDDARARRPKIIEAALELLNHDGGFLMVGVRRRYQNATRGADLEMTPEQLHDFVMESITPSPVLRVRSRVEQHGPVHELVIVAAENQAGVYRRRASPATEVAEARALRTGLERVGALDVAAMTQRLSTKAHNGSQRVPMKDLVRLWPLRRWFTDDKRFTELVSESIAAHAMESDASPRWLQLWGRELPRARRTYIKTYADLARQAVLVNHRDDLREALRRSVQTGSISRPERTSVEKWFERQQARIDSGGPIVDHGDANLDEIRSRAESVFGDEIGQDLDTAAKEAADEYRAAMREAYGAQASVVIDATSGGGSSVRLEDVPNLSHVITNLPSSGTAGVVAVPDRISSLNANELLDYWAAPAEPTTDDAPRLIRRCIEAGSHLPIFRFASVLDRAQLAELLDGALDDVGTRQLREYVIQDLRRATASSPPIEDREKQLRDAVDRIQSATDTSDLKLAARLSLDLAPTVTRMASQSVGLRTAIANAAATSSPVQVRRPALVLLGAAGDTGLLEQLPNEQNRQVRISLIQGIGLLPPETPGRDEALIGGLRETGSIVRFAARALASMGAAGYELLTACLPSDRAARGYALKGMAEVSTREPCLARALARGALDVQDATVLSAVRAVDEALHLRRAQARLADSVANAG